MIISEAIEQLRKIEEEHGTGLELRSESDFTIANFEVDESGTFPVVVINEGSPIE